MSEKQVNVVDCNRKSEAVNVEGNKKRKKSKSDKQGNAEDCNRNVEGVNVVASEKRKEATSKKHVIVDDCNEDKKEPRKGNLRTRKSARACDDFEKSTASKRVSFADDVEVFSLSDCPSDEHEDLVRGKRFSEEEDKILKEAVLRYIETHTLGDDGLDMVLRCKSHPEVKNRPELKNCWKDIVGRNQVKDASYLAEVAKISGKMNFYDHITLGNCSPLEAKQKILGEVIKLGHKIFVSKEFEEESELKRQLQVARGECDDAKLKISSLTKEVSTLKKKLEKQTKESKALEAQGHERKREVERLAKELEDRDANLVLAQAGLASAEEEVQRLKKEIEDVVARKDQERVEAVEKEREQARSNQAMLNSLSGAIDIFERNLAEEKNQTGPLNEGLCRLFKLACDNQFQYFMDKGVIDKKVLLALQEEEKKKYDQLEEEDDSGSEAIM